MTNNFKWHACGLSTQPLQNKVLEKRKIGIILKKARNIFKYFMCKIVARYE